MKNGLLLLMLFCLYGQTGFSQEKPAYRIYQGDGREVNYGEMLQQIAETDIIFFGELHDNPIAHWLELEISRDLQQGDRPLSIGLEMFEADDQLILDEYLQGIIEERHLLSEAKIWDNYATDYRPLVELAKNHRLKVVATNIPRRYANLIFRDGFSGLDSLSAQAKQWIAPLPIMVNMQLSIYQELLKGMSGHGGHSGAERLVQAQAAKDATMAYFIGQSLTEGARFIHFNGAYHSRKKEGIIWYLQRNRPDLKIATIETVEQSDINNLKEDNRHVADFIICIPKSMTKTFKNH